MEDEAGRENEAPLEAGTQQLADERRASRRRSLRGPGGRRFLLFGAGVVLLSCVIFSQVGPYALNNSTTGVIIGLFVGLAAFLLFASIAWNSVGPIVYGLAANRQVTATVLSSEYFSTRVHPRNAAPHLSMRVRPTVRYVLEGEEMRVDIAPSHTRQNLGAVSRDDERFRPGEALTLWLDPDDPRTPYFRRVLPGDVLSSLLVVPIFLAVCIGWGHNVAVLVGRLG